MYACGRKQPRNFDVQLTDSRRLDNAQTGNLPPAHVPERSCASELCAMDNGALRGTEMHFNHISKII
jgi:hypothetical protein